MKIVSLLPAATEIVCALGLRESLVGRSHECDFPEDVTALPPLTRARVDSSLPSARLDEEVRRIMAARLPIYSLDEARLSALAPDVVVTQAACEVCAIAYDQVVASLRERLERVSVSSGTGARPRVAVVEWLAPPMLAGHWVPDAIEAAGGVPVGPAPGTLSPYAAWNEIRSLAADAVVVAPCGFDLERTVAEAAAVAETLRGLGPRVLLLDGNAYLNRPGPRLVLAVETIAAWLRGDAVPEDKAVPLEAAIGSEASPSRA